MPKKLGFNLRDAQVQRGQAVEYRRHGVYVPIGAYEVTAKLPERDGEFEYRIKHPTEPHERLAKESELRAI